jgi:trans-aconitate 2-methyltransferase
MESTKRTWNADDYQKNSSAQLQWAQELITKLALRGSEWVLDIGCGDGRVSARLAAAVEKGFVLGIDSSEEMIRHAIAQFPATANPNLSFRLMDATQIGLSERFDIAFSNAALHWTGDHAAVLRGVRSCLKSGGRILFQMGGRGNAAEVSEVIGEIIKRQKWWPYFKGFIPPYHFYGPEEYRTWLPEAGFLSVRTELTPKDMQYGERQGLLGWLRTTWFPYTERIPAAEKRDAFLDEIVDSYTATHPPDSSGTIHVKMVRLETEAVAI